MAALPRPPVPEGPVRALFDALHALHHRAGWPSLRVIAKDVGCSHTTVSAAFSEPRVPRWGLLELIVESLGGDTELFHRLWLAASTAESAPDGPMPHQPGPRGTDPRASVPPRQLVTDVAGFTGRGHELAQLDALLRTSGGTAEAGDGAATASVVVVSGTAGVGKTALAVHWAHRVAGRFPDGQVYVNLRGFDPTGSPVAPAQAVRALLDAFSVPPHQIPAGLDAQVALYRSVLAGRRVLVVLDNARDADQVRPLLPGTAGCLTVVTSRNELSGLVAAEGAYPMVLDLMSVEESRDLIAGRIGAGRAAAEPAAVDQIVASCARLPLALAVVAARAATHPRFGLAAVAGELGAARDSLDVFDSADLTTDVRAVLSWSYLQLSPEAARLFRLFGLHPGPDLAAPAAASLAGSSPREVRRTLAELARTHLVAEHIPGRYRFHDLLRAYAVELAPADGGDERRAARHRMLDHYLHTAHGAAMLLSRHRHPITIDAPQPGAAAQPLGDGAQASAWLTAERPVLLSLVRLAAAAGFDRHAWQLAWTLTTFLDRNGHWHDWAATQQAAVESARRVSDPDGRAYAHRGLALAQYRLGQYQHAHANLSQALDLFTVRGDHAGQAYTHLDLAWALERQGRYRAALHHAHQALDLHRRSGHESGQARALNSVGWLLARLDDHQAALTYCRQAHDLFRQLDDRAGEAGTWDSLGYAHHRLGHHDEAISCYRRAVELLQDIGDRYHEAESRANLGDALLAAADAAGARQQWRHAVRIFSELGHPDAAGVRDRLERLPREPHPLSSGTGPPHAPRSGKSAAASATETT
ncbi:MAG TPA: tetratricopeptide repeat protein [Micromonosporaceae bacterium]|nr:tetratricopeptide repeat protein [Micromonosporaceae bacterium]